MISSGCCGVWLVPIYTNIMSCFVEDLNNQHSGSCLELLYDPSGVVVMSQLLMEVHLTEAAGGFPGFCWLCTWWCVWQFGPVAESRKL